MVALEKGQDRKPGEDFILPSVRDEVRYAQRLELMWDNSLDTLTFRNFSNERALPIRRIGAFLPGEGVGGSGIHWGALHWRFLPYGFSHPQRADGALRCQRDPRWHDHPGLAGQLR